MHVLWFASAELKEVLPVAEWYGIDLFPPKAPPLLLDWALWQEEQRKFIGSSIRRAWFEPCGLWQMVQSSRTG